VSRQCICGRRCVGRARAKHKAAHEAAGYHHLDQARTYLRMGLASERNVALTLANVERGLIERDRPGLKLAMVNALESSDLSFARAATDFLKWGLS
jgi:hypothetical protein